MNDVSEERGVIYKKQITLDIAAQLAIDMALKMEKNALEKWAKEPSRSGFPNRCLDDVNSAIEQMRHGMIIIVEDQS